MDPLQDHDVVGERTVGGGIVISGGTHDVAQHGAGLDAGQLERVAHEHDPGVGAQSIEESGHEGQGHHRSLVDHHDVVGERVGAVVAERDSVAVAQEPVDGAGLTGQQRLGRSFGHVGAGHGLMHGLGHPRCGLARWGGQCHLEGPVVIDGLLVEGR